MPSVACNQENILEYFGNWMLSFKINIEHVIPIEK